MSYVALSSKAVGSVVKLKENGTLVNYIVVNQGKPSSIYDDSCDGTWLLRESLYETRQWHSSNVNDYANSTIKTYLNGTFLALFDSAIQNAIKQVKIPYRPGSGTSSTVNSGSSGLSCKIFLLSGYEMGWTSSDNQYFPADGAKLSYFDSGTGTTANNKRIAYLSGSATFWWLRSPNTSSSVYAWRVYTDGSYNGNYCSYSFGVRPALVLPSSLLVSEDGSVTTNTAPGTPASITIPSSISGGTSITVSWGAAADAENNLEGYIVEKSTNGGSTWSQIYQGSSLSTTNSVAFGTESVMYRVKAYDRDGLESGYKTSSQVTVINNVSPGAPASINVPLTVDGGKTLSITWGAATDSDGNLSGYALERSVDGGSYAEVYRGDALSYTDTITKGWNTVAYRVRAYDAYTAYSSYTTSNTRTVNNNTAPTITCSYASGSDLGTKASGFTISYTVDDVDGDSVTVTEIMDSTTKRTFTATLGSANSFAVTGDYFMKLLNGSHTMKITANDGKATTTYTLTFTKSVTSASITLESAMDADDQITICALSVIGSIPADADYTVEVTNNANDTEPVWEDCTTAVKNGANHVFTNTAAANGFAFNFRVNVSRASGGDGGYITSIQGGFQ